MKEEEGNAVPGGAADDAGSTPSDVRSSNAPGDSGIEPMTFDNPEAQRNEERDKTMRARAKNVVLRSIIKTGWWWPDGT